MPKGAAVGKPWTQAEEGPGAQVVWQATGRWIAGYRWQLYGILTFAHPPRPETVQKAVTIWLTELQASYPRLFAYWSADRGPVSDRWNIHVLLGGLFTDRPPPEPHYGMALQVARETASQLWHRGQVVKVERYAPLGGMISYMTQPHTWADPEVPGTLFGNPIRKSHGRRDRSPNGGP